MDKKLFERILEWTVVLIQITDWARENVRGDLEEIWNLSRWRKL